MLTNTPQGEFKWRGKLWGSSLFFVGEHYFQVKPTPGGTVFVHGEEFRGCLVPLLGGVVKQVRPAHQWGSGVTGVVWDTACTAR